MSKILTQRMNTLRSFSPAASAPTPVFHMPFTETAGTTVTDAIGGVVVTPDAISFAVSNAVTLNSVTTITPTTGTIPSLAAGVSGLMIFCFKTGNGTLGRSVDYGLKSSDGQAIFMSAAKDLGITPEGDANTALDPGTAPSNDVDRMMAILLDRSSNTLYGWEAISGGAVTDLTGSADITGFDMSSIDNVLIYGGAVGITPNDMYSHIFYQWTGSIPADLTTALEWYRDKPVAGNKARYPGWL